MFIDDGMVITNSTIIYLSVIYCSIKCINLILACHVINNIIGIRIF